MRKILLLTCLSVVSVSAFAQTTRSYTWDKSQNGINNAAGTFDSINSTFNAATNRLTWSSTFTGSTVPEGFWLAISGGPNPKGIAGELALFYFDATKSGGPRLTAYGYNGVNGNTSYFDGNGAVSGNQAPDKIISSVTNSSWINSLTYSRANGKTTMSFDINATAINNRTSPYSTNGSWSGAKYGDKIGIWFHTARGLTTEYGTDGFLKNFSACTQGWFDGQNFNTQAVPEPASMAALGLGAIAVIRRKRAAKK